MKALDISLLENVADAVLDGAAAHSPLSRRALLALAAMDELEDTVITNHSLREIFLKQKLSSESSVQKDSSAAKGELLDMKCIEIVGKVSMFSVTDHGRRVISEFDGAIESEIDKLDHQIELQAILRAGLPNLVIAAGLANPSTPSSALPARAKPTSFREAGMVGSLAVSMPEIASRIDGPDGLPRTQMV